MKTWQFVCFSKKAPVERRYRLFSASAQTAYHVYSQMTFLFQGIFFLCFFFLGGPPHLSLFMQRPEPERWLFACGLWLLPDFLIYTDEKKKEQAERQMWRRWPWNICQWYDSWPGLDWLDSKWWTGRRGNMGKYVGKRGKGGWNNSML